MSKTEQRRQKKLAKKRSKEVVKRKQLARQRNVMQSVAGQVGAAASGSIKHCLMSDGLFKEDIEIGMVLISRQLSDGRLVCVWFLIDALCLGVKDHHVLVGYPSQINDYVEQVGERQSLRSVSPSFARKFVESAVDYANRFDLPPASGYQKLAAIWGDIDPSECSEEFRFGDASGKPRYVSGPHDSPEFQARIIDALQRTAGEGNFDFVVMVGSDFAGLERPELLAEDGPDQPRNPDNIV